MASLQLNRFFEKAAFHPESRKRATSGTGRVLKVQFAGYCRVRESNSRASDNDRPREAFTFFPSRDFFRRSYFLAPNDFNQGLRRMSVAGLASWSELAGNARGSPASMAWTRDHSTAERVNASTVLPPAWVCLGASTITSNSNNLHWKTLETASIR